MNSGDCPTEAELNAFQQGKLLPDQVEQVASHLETCPACGSVVQATGEHGGASTASLGGVSPGETADMEAGPAPTITVSGTAAAVGSDFVGTGTLLSGRYELLEPIGEGGMGSVWSARQVAPVRRMVAVKLIKAGMDSQQVLTRFEAERQALALMDHQNIAKVLDAGATPTGQPYFVMELVQGVPITRYCDEQRLTPRERLELFVPVCRAIQHAHQKGIIHRDIKPGNVLVALYDGKPVPKVIDFGVAKAVEQPLTDGTLVTQFGAVVGTPEYMSPEQADLDQQDVDTRSDVFALGVLLYELLTGTTPLDRARLRRAAIMEVLRLVREEEPPRPSTRLSSSEGLPDLAARRRTEPGRLASLMRGELDWITMRALEKDRSRRYETSDALARDVERYLTDEPVEACPPSARYRLAKLARRHKTALRGAAAVACVLVAATAVSAWQAVRATRAEGLERQQRERSESRYALAREAIEGYYTGASEDVLLKEPRLKELRAKLLGAALAFYRKLQAEQERQGSSTPAERADLATAYERVATLSHEIGSKQEALAGYDRAVALRRDLAAASPADPARRRELGSLYYQIGMVWNDLEPFETSADWHKRAIAEHEAAARATNSLDDRLEVAKDLIQVGRSLAQTPRVDEALAAYDRASDLLRALVNEYPRDSRPRNQLALALFNGGHARMNAASFPLEALRMMRESNATLEVLVKEEPGELLHRRHLSRGYHWVGVVQHQLGRLEDSLRSYAQALEMEKALERDHPTLTWVRRTLADTHIGIGISLSESNREREAVAEYEGAKAVFEALARENPGVVLFRHRLAACEDSIGLALDSLGDGPAALRGYLRAIGLREQTVREAPTTVVYRSLLGETYGHVADHYRRRGNRAESLAYYRKAIDTIGGLAHGNVTGHVGLAICLAGCSSVIAADTARPTAAERAEREALADRAVVHLRKAVAAGYTNLAEVDKETAFDAIRDRPDFQALRLDMGFPADPFAR